VTLSFICVTCLIHVWDVTHSCGWHDLFACVQLVHRVLYYVAVCCSVLQCMHGWCVVRSVCCCMCCKNTLQHTATHCNTLQHTATHCNANQYIATHHALQHTAPHCNTLQRTATHYNTLHFTTTPYNTLQHTAARQKQ